MGCPQIEDISPLPCIVPLVNMKKKKNAPPPLFVKLPTPLNIITRAGLNPNQDRS